MVHLCGLRMCTRAGIRMGPDPLKVVNLGSFPATAIPDDEPDEPGKLGACTCGPG